MQREALFVAEMIDAATRVVELTAGTSVGDLDGDRTRRESLLWSFTVLGEASSQISETTKANYPEVPWRAVSALRNRLVHAYWQVSTQILLSIAQDDVPNLLSALDAMQKDLGGAETLP